MPLRLPIMLVAPALAITLGVAGRPAQAQGFTPPQREEIGGIVRDYLSKHPELVRDAIVELQRREKADEAALREKTLSENSDLILKSAHQAVIGNPNGKITLVEFYDYNCGYCKKALGDVARLIKENPDLRVVMKN